MAGGADDSLVSGSPRREVRHSTSRLLLACGATAVGFALIGRYGLPYSSQARDSVPSRLGGPLKGLRRDGDLLYPVPPAKALVWDMDMLIAVQYKWDDYGTWSKTMLKYFAPDFTYDLSYPRSGIFLNDTGIYQGLHAWFDGEHVPWNVALPHTKFAGANGLVFAGWKDMVTCTLYATAKFVAPMKGIPNEPTEAKKQELRKLHGSDYNVSQPLLVTLVDLDFYAVGPSARAGGQLRILYNWCMMDLHALLHVTGRDMGIVPRARLKQGLWYPPRTMQGSPAPFSEYTDPAVTEVTNQIIRARVLQMLARGKYPASQDTIAWNGRRILANPSIEGGEFFTDDAVMYANPQAVGAAFSQADMLNEVLAPLFHEPFVATTGPSFEVRLDQVFCEGFICGAHGYVHGVPDEGTKFLGYDVSKIPMPPGKSHRELSIRFGIHIVMDEATLLFRDIFCLVDVLNAFDSMGRDIISEAQRVT